MAVVLEDTIIGIDGGAGDSALWAPPAVANPTYTWYSGDKQKVPSTPLITSLDAADLFALSISAFEHGGADGMPHAMFVNDRHDRIIPMSIFACAAKYASPGPNGGGPYAAGGNNDGYRVECMFDPPQGDYMFHFPYGGWGTGTTQSNFVFDPYDPIHAMDDDGHCALFIFSGLDPSVTPVCTQTDLSKMVSSNSDTVAMTVDTPHANDYVIDVLIISRFGTNFTMEPSNAEQTVLFYHEAGHLISGFANADYYSVGSSQALYQYYVSIRARGGATTDVGWDFLTGSGTKYHSHVAIVVRAL